MKYMGSKNRIAKHIVPIMQKEMKEGFTFVDVFCGGCNLVDKIEGKRVANDNNKYLIAMWKGLQENRERPYKIPKELYTEARDLYNSKTTNENFDEFLIGWIGWMGSYNGRFFDGGYSGHSVGKSNRDYISEQIRNTEKQIENIKDIQFTSLDFKDIVFNRSNLVVYCDPPYKDTKQYSTSKNFDHDTFWEWCRNVSSKGIKIFISEYSAPDDFKCIWGKEVTNSMNTTKTYKPTEKLFTL